MQGGARVYDMILLRRGACGASTGLYIDMVQVVKVPGAVEPCLHGILVSDVRSCCLKRCDGM